MMLKSLISCSWLQIFFGLFLLHLIHCDCRFPRQKISNGKYIYNRRIDARKHMAPESYVLKYTCYKGYSQIGPSFIQCLDGEWSGVLPKCIPMECSDPPDVGNATYTLSNDGVPSSLSHYYLETRVTYSCKKGYELSDFNSSTLVCDLDPKSNQTEWKGELPSCQEMKICPDPGVPKNGTREGNCLTKDSNSCYSDSFLRFSCPEDYELVGNKEIMCQKSGLWSSGRPLCKPPGVHCELPPAIPHGIVTGDKNGDYFLPEDEAEILCEPGYKYKGPQQFILCNEGEWEVEFGECVEIFCDLPEHPANGTILELLTTNLTSFPYKFEITYECDDGYRLLGGDSWRICGKNGWSGKKPFCKEIRCPDPGVPEHGDRDGNDFRVGSKVRFRCFTGYNLLGSFERYCMPNGQWTGELARCDVSGNYCPNPGIPINGFKNSTNYNMGDKVGFRCREGYIRIGSEARSCFPNRTWSGSETKCVGPYDFDNSKQISEIMKARLDEQFDEEYGEEKRYMQAVKAQWRNGTIGLEGRMLNVNYQGRLILYFAFDVSGSVGRLNFQKSIDFAKAIVKKVGISEDGARAGALIFSSKAENVFLPMHLSTTEDVLNALDGIEYTGGGTAATSALNLIKENMALEDNWFERKDKKDVVFIITDGKANMGGSPEVEAESLKKGGVDIYCIGITGDPHIDSLYKIASSSKYGNEERPNVFILQNYATLSWLVQEITNGTLDYSQCGLGMENIGNEDRGRIAGGRNSTEPWPWMAALFFMPIGGQKLDDFQLQCGGSIINRNFILTAAHCMFVENWEKKDIFERRKEEIIVKLGLKNIKNEAMVQDYGVKRMIIHERYHTGNLGARLYDYDIALLQLDRPVEYGPFIRPVCLPPKALPENSPLYNPNEFGWATGWGHTDVWNPNDGTIRFKSSQNLKEIRLPIQSEERCIISLENRNFNKDLFTKRMFCAGDGKSGNDTCRGDSGGPLMQSQMNSDGYIYWTQVGIVSWGVGCGLENTYGYYTHVRELRSWIDDKINALKLDEPE